MLCTTSEDHSRATEAYLSAAKAQQHLLVRNHNMQTPVQQRYVQWAAEPYGKGHAVGRGVRIQLVQQDHDLLIQCAEHFARLVFERQELRDII